MDNIKGVRGGTVLYYLRVRAALVGLFLLFAYWPVAVLTDNDAALETLRALQISISSVVLFSYAPEAWRILTKPYVDAEDQLILGIVLAWASVFEQGVWALLWRLSGKPMWMYDSDLNGFFVWQAIIGATLHVTAPGAVNGVVPKRNWILTGVAFVGGVLVGCVLLRYRPDAQGVVNWLEEWASPYPVRR